MEHRTRLLGSRGKIPRTADSRQFVDSLLGELAASGFRLRGWARFFRRSLVRSVDQLGERPHAAAEVTALHLLAVLAGGRRWAVASWVLCVTHLGLLGDRSTLGWPNRLTLLRALLPSFASDSRWTALVALATDVMDGQLARPGGESAFGAYADPIADGVFWTSHALRWEPNRWLRWVPAIIFGTSLAGISVAYFTRGRTIDYPRPVALRYASATAQVVLTMRTLRVPERMNETGSAASRSRPKRK